MKNMEQWSSSALISQANKLLDYLELSGDEGKMRVALSEAIGKLSKLKSQMLFHGFNAPFLSLLAQSRSEFEEMDEGDSRDLAKQLVLIRDFANSKKLTLNRVRVALNASRMALEALEDGDAELARAFPVRGDYLQTLVQAPDILYSYYPMMGILERECGKRAKVVFTVVYKRGGNKAATAKISLSEGKDAERYVKYIYGEGARITESKVQNIPELIVKKRSVRICIAVAFAILGYKKALPEAQSAPRIGAKLAQYEEFMHSRGFNPGARLDLADGHEEEKKELVKTGLAKQKGEAIVLDDDVSLGLASKRKALRTGSSSYAKQAFAMFLFRHFILKSKRSRDNSATLPSFKPEYLHLLSDVFVELSRPPLLLSSPERLIERKLEAEATQPKIDSRLFGSAFVFLTTDKDTAWCSEHFKVGAEELKKAAASIAGMIDARKDKLSELGLGERGARAGEFTQLLKKAGSAKGKPQPKGRKQG